jgi:hypothetical protein
MMLLLEKVSEQLTEEKEIAFGSTTALGRVLLSTNH